jgi:hypothetical protein
MHPRISSSNDVGAGAKIPITRLKNPPPTEGEQPARFWMRRRAGCGQGRGVDGVIELKRQGMSNHASYPVRGRVPAKFSSDPFWAWQRRGMVP